MYKSVSFNIFEEQLEEIVYGKNPVTQTEKNDANEKTVVVIGEITIPKIADQNSDTNSYKRFVRELSGALNVL